MNDDDLLAQPLDEADLQRRLRDAAPRRLARSTLILAAIALLLVGFAFGALTGRAMTELRYQREPVDGEPAAAAMLTVAT